MNIPGTIIPAYRGGVSSGGCGGKCGGECSGGSCGGKCGGKCGGSQANNNRRVLDKGGVEPRSVNLNVTPSMPTKCSSKSIGAPHLGGLLASDQEMRLPGLPASSRTGRSEISELVEHVDGVGGESISYDGGGTSIVKPEDECMVIFESNPLCIPIGGRAGVPFSCGGKCGIAGPDCKVVKRGKKGMTSCRCDCESVGHVSRKEKKKIKKFDDEGRIPLCPRHRALTEKGNWCLDCFTTGNPAHHCGLACYRNHPPTPPKTSGPTPGQQCCYDRHGQLITEENKIAYYRNCMGSVDRVNTPNGKRNNGCCGWNVTNVASHQATDVKDADACKDYGKVQSCMRQMGIASGDRSGDPKGTRYGDFRKAYRACMKKYGCKVHVPRNH